MRAKERASRIEWKNPIRWESRKQSSEGHVLVFRRGEKIELGEALDGFHTVADESDLDRGEDS